MNIQLEIKGKDKQVTSALNQALDDWSGKRNLVLIISAETASEIKEAIFRKPINEDMVIDTTI